MKSILRRKCEYIVMASVGKLIFGFFILATCFVGAMMIFAQQSKVVLSDFTIGNTSEMLNNTSAINQTTGLVASTTSFGTGAGVIMLFIIGALIIIAALALIAGRTK